MARSICSHPMTPASSFALAADDLEAPAAKVFGVPPNSWMVFARSCGGSGWQGANAGECRGDHGATRLGIWGRVRSIWGTLFKPYAWQGDLCFGPSQGTRVTFTTPRSASSRWVGLPDPDEAAPAAISAYLRAYGPARSDSFIYWMGSGRVGKRRIRAWFEAIGSRLAEVEVGGERAFVLAEDLDDLRATKPSRTVRLVPGFDQFVLGPGTHDGHVVPTRRRAAVSKQSGWISPVVLVGGVVRGTWGVSRDRVQVAWFKEAGAARRTALQAEVERLSTILGRELRLELGSA